jgi:hypothetical protein
MQKYIHRGLKIVATLFGLASAAACAPITQPSPPEISIEPMAASRFGASRFGGLDVDAGRVRQDDHIVFITPGVGGTDIDYSRLSPNAVVLHTPARNAASYILDRLQERVQAHGTIKEIVIEAHGTSGRINTAENRFDSLLAGSESEIQISGLLKALEALQAKTGQKIADRLVFGSCDTLTDLSPSRTQAYREATQKLGMELVGTTSLMTGRAFGSEANFVVFRADGHVQPDKLGFGSLPPEPAHSAAWFDCHAGVSQAEGAACQAKLPAEEQLTALRIDLSDPDFPPVYKQASAHQLLGLATQSESSVTRISALLDIVKFAASGRGSFLPQAVEAYVQESARSWPNASDRVANLRDIVPFVPPGSESAQKIANLLIVDAPQLASPQQQMAAMALAQQLGSFPTKRPEGAVRKNGPRTAGL